MTPTVLKMCVSHRRELGFEAVILKRVIIDNPEIRLAPIQNYDFHLVLKIVRNARLRSILSKPAFLPRRELHSEAVISKRMT